MSRITTLLLALALASPLAPAHGQHSEHAGKQHREVAALSEEETANLLAGEGMGMALAAELNGYPGPRHVLELKEPLGLSSQDAASVERARAAMRERAAALGAQIVARERELDRRFAARTIDEPGLRALTAEIARLQGELRFVHLRAHLETTALLTGEQIRAYDRLRGYGGHP